MQEDIMHTYNMPETSRHAAPTSVFRRPAIIVTQKTTIVAQLFSHLFMNSELLMDSECYIY